MPNYKQSKIYALKSYEGDDIYIGSTTQLLSKSLYEHKKKYKTRDGATSSVKLFEKYDKVFIELIEEVECENAEQLKKIKGKYIIKYCDVCVNINISGRTKKEYRDENKEKMKKYQSEYKKKLEVKITCECGSKIRTDCKKRHIKSNKHLKHILGMMRDPNKISCECGGKYRPKDKKRHGRTTKHIKFLEEKEKNNDIGNTKCCLICGVREKDGILLEENNLHCIGNYCKDCYIFPMNM
jgi:hypothetical protein